MRQRTRTRITALTGASLLLPLVLHADLHFGLTRSRRCIPNYGYAADQERLIGLVDSAPAVPIRVAVSDGVTRRKTQLYSASDVPGGTRSVHERSRARLANPVTMEAKQFVIGPVSAGPVLMTMPAATIYENGDFHFSCRLNRPRPIRTVVDDPTPKPFVRPRFDPIPANRCFVRVQGLGGTPPAPGGETTGPIIFEYSREVRVQERNQAVRFCLGSRDTDLVRRHFAEISRLRVYLECQLDR